MKPIFTIIIPTITVLSGAGAHHAPLDHRELQMTATAWAASHQYAFSIFTPLLGA
jgi:hypothetical protein